MKRTLIIWILLICSVSIFSQTSDTDTASYNPKESGVKQFQPPVFRGVSAHLDVASPLMGLVYSNKIFNIETQVDVNLFDRLFPILEVGFTSVDKSVGEASYITRAPFFKVGINYGLMKGYDKKGEPRSLKNYPFVGVRYGFSPMNYQLNNIVVRDDYWGEEVVRNYSKSLLYAGWVELVAGVRIELIKGVTMGWSVRFKMALHSAGVEKEKLWYVPGFGITNSSSFSFNYTIGYTFRTKPKTEK